MSKLNDTYDDGEMNRTWKGKRDEHFKEEWKVLGLAYTHDKDIEKIYSESTREDEFY